MKNSLYILALVLLLWNCKREDTVLLSENIELREDRIIQDYLKENNLTAQKTSSGIYYRITQLGSGSRPSTGDSIVADYVAQEIYGQVFESSYITKVPQKFRLGIKKSPSLAWEEMPTLLTKGEKAIFYVPSRLARETGSKNSFFPPQVVIIFEVKLTELVRQ